MNKLLSLAMLAIVAATGVKADGLTPSGTPALGLCYTSGSSGPRVPCVQQGTTWMPVLRPADDGSGLSITVGPNALPLADRLRSTAAGVDLLAYVPMSVLRAGGDTAPYFAAAITAARSAGARLLVPGVPGLCFVLKNTVDFSGVEIAGGGGCVLTNDPIDMFATTALPGNIHDLTIYHRGSTGRVFNLAYDGNEIHHNRIISDISTAKGPVLDFSTSNNHIRFNNFTNLRTGELTWRNIRNDANKISINNQFVNNYLGGPASGGWIGDDGSAPRPEGTLVAFNESVLTGGPFLTIRSVLNARVFGNMMDQGNNTGAVRFEPGGYNGYGVDGVLLGGNYISAPGGGGAAAIVSIAGVGGAGAGGVSVVNNQLAYGLAAAQLAKGFAGSFYGNYNHGFSGSACYLVSDVSLLAAVDFGPTSQCSDKPKISVAGGTPGDVRSTKIGTYDTATGGGYINIPHGLVTAPTKFRATASIAGAGGASLQAVSVVVAAADAANVTLAIAPTGIATQGKIFITLDSEI